MNAQTSAFLQEVVRNESLSLLTYIGDAFPWTTKGRDAALAQLRQIVAEHKRAVNTLGHVLAQHRVAPAFIGSFPSNFTAINFLSLDYILSRLIESERKSLPRLESETTSLAEVEVRSALEHFLAVKRNHLAQLEALQSAPPATTPTSAAS
jgi:hypothetical protein